MQSYAASMDVISDLELSWLKHKMKFGVLEQSKATLAQAKEETLQFRRQSFAPLALAIPCAACARPGETFNNDALTPNSPD
jgi:hypothetical protein